MSSTIGNIIDAAIVKKGISPPLICEGLCTPYTLSRYRSGERRMDRLFLNAILQKLGMAPEDFVTVLTEREYEYFVWQEKIFSALQDRDYEAVETLHLERSNRKTVCNKRLETQFLLRIEGILAYWKEKDIYKALEKFEDAARLTMPAYGKDSLFNKILGSGDIQILLSICELKTEISEKDRNEERLKQLDKNLNLIMNYIEMKMPDERELTKLYPEVARIYGQLLCREGNLEKGAMIYRQAIELMRDNNSSYLLEELLEKYIDTKDKLGKSEEAVQEKEWLECWRYVRESVKLPKPEYYCLGSGSFGQRIELISELVKMGRKEVGYTQEELSELVDCDVANLNRIENGKAAPRAKRYKKLMEELGRPQEYYYSDIITTDYRAYELKYKLEKALMDRDYHILEKYLDELQNIIGTKYSINKQYLGRVRLVMNSENGKITLEDELNGLISLLGLTYDISKINKTNHIYSINVEKIILRIAGVYGLLKQNDKKLEILEKLNEFYNNSFIDIKYHYKTVLSCMSNLCATYALNGDLDKIKELSLKGILMDLKCNKGKIVVDMLLCYGDYFYENKNKAAALKCMKTAASIAELFKQYRLQGKAERNCQKINMLNNLQNN